jgi:hypothetical protein
MEEGAEKNPSMAMVVGDLASVGPSRPRGIKIHRRGEIGKTAHGRDAIYATHERKLNCGPE